MRPSEEAPELGRWGVVFFSLTVEVLAGVAFPEPSLVGVRAVGMGEAFSALAEGGSGVFHNPAGFGVGRGVTLFGQTNLFPRETLRFDPKGIVYRLDGWGFGWSNKVALVPDGVYDYTYVGMGGRLSSSLAMGFHVKLWRSHPSEHFQVLGKAATYDVGVLGAPGTLWRIGCNVGTLRRGGHVEMITLGVARRFTFPREGWLTLESDWNRSDGFRLQVGAEVSPTRWSALRIGFRGETPTGGIGVRFRGVRIDLGGTEVEGRLFLFVGAEVVVGDFPFGSE